MFNAYGCSASRHPMGWEEAQKNYILPKIPRKCARPATTPSTKQNTKYDAHNKDYVKQDKELRAISPKVSALGALLPRFFTLRGGGYAT